MNLSIRHLLTRKFNIRCNFQLCMKYSRKKNATGNIGPYKIVKTENSCDDLGNLNQSNNSNWELFATYGYPFYLPGNIGPAWQNTETSEFYTQTPLLNNTLTDKPPNVKDDSEKKFQCIVQECPLVLRNGVEELFAGRDLKHSTISVVTLLQRPNLKQLNHSNKEFEIEELAKRFVLAAQTICMTLTVMGYWADFINPFSGKPYLSPVHNGSLYNTDERFRCLDFQIIKQHNCVIIFNESDNHNRTFIGTLFTNAPYNITYLQDLKTQLF